ncbi:MAG TPA: glycosyltransferase family 2 protein [Burkholderiales bacterium]|nr:glycosyltransferase family 2 protein [Burkholderiales bacterium]
MAHAVNAAMSARNALLSVVVPCFNEEAVIGLTHQRLVASLGGDPSFDLEIVYVDDGSRDRTEEMLFDLADRDARVKVVSFTRNFGHQPAVSAGMRYASGDAVAVIDADLQDPPEVILRLVEKWREGYDVVNAVRENRKEGVAKRFAYALFYRTYRWLASVDVPLDSGDFALMDRRVVDVVNALPEKNRFVRGLRSWSGFRQTGVAYERQSRAAGETKYSFRRLVRLAFDGIVNFSTAPLSLIFGLGVVTAFLALLAAVAYLVWRLVDVPILGYTPGQAPGFTTLILVILFFSGVQLISIGILGEYLGRIYEETKMRPTYVVKEVRGGRQGLPHGATMLAERERSELRT